MTTLGPPMVFDYTGRPSQLRMLHRDDCPMR
jgi:hypothetical protein